MLFSSELVIDLLSCLAKEFSSISQNLKGWLQKLFFCASRKILDKKRERQKISISCLMKCTFGSECIILVVIKCGLFK